MASSLIREEIGMARAKRQSDEVYNARRRAKRLLARVERDFGRGKIAKSQYVALRQELTPQIEKSYQPKTESVFERGKRMEAVQHLRYQVGMMREQMGKAGSVRELVSQQSFMRAANGEKNIWDRSIKSAGMSGRNTAAIVYFSTIQLWQGKPYRERNQIIMRALGTKTWDETVQYILSRNQKYIEEVLKNENSPYDTLTDMLDETDDVPEQGGSPIELMYANAVVS